MKYLLLIVLTLFAGCDPCTKKDLQATQVSLEADIAVARKHADEAQNLAERLGMELTDIRARLKQLEERPAYVPEPHGQAEAAAVLPAGWSVHFWTQTGCVPCRQWEASEQPKLGDSVVTFYYHKHKDEAERLGVGSTPTVMLVSPQNKIRHRWNYGAPAEDIISKAHELDGRDGTT